MIVFFFKQKTEYEMRISDWSSDVCSSDLPARKPAPAFRDRKIEPPGMARNQMRQPRRCRRVEQHLVPRIGQPEQGIVPERAVDQPGLLREIPEMLAQQILGELGQREHGECDAALVERKTVE